MSRATLRIETYPGICISPSFIELSNFDSLIASTSKVVDVKIKRISSICFIKLFTLMQAILKPLILAKKFKGELILLSVNVGPHGFVPK